MSKKFMITVNGNSYEVMVDEIKEDGVVAAAPVAPQAARVVPKAAPAAPQAPKASASAGGKKITAPMPGSIVKVNVKAGDKFSKGDIVAVIEAMKMENEITAPEDGVVADVSVSQGAAVDTGAVLIVYN